MAGGRGVGRAGQRRHQCAFHPAGDRAVPQRHGGGPPVRKGPRARPVRSAGRFRHSAPRRPCATRTETPACRVAINEGVVIRQPDAAGRRERGDIRALQEARFSGRARAESSIPSSRSPAAPPCSARLSACNSSSAHAPMTACVAATSTCCWKCRKAPPARPFRRAAGSADRTRQWPAQDRHPGGRPADTRRPAARRCQLSGHGLGWGRAKVTAAGHPGGASAGCMSHKP